LEKTVSRETSGERAAMFHVKHWANGPENTILQNNPMH